MNEVDIFFFGGGIFIVYCFFGFGMVFGGYGGLDIVYNLVVKFIFDLD